MRLLPRVSSVWVCREAVARFASYFAAAAAMRVRIAPWCWQTAYAHMRGLEARTNLRNDLLRSLRGIFVLTLHELQELLFLIAALIVEIPSQELFLQVLVACIHDLLEKWSYLRLAFAAPVFDTRPASLGEEMLHVDPLITQSAMWACLRRFLIVLLFTRLHHLNPRVLLRNLLPRLSPEIHVIFLQFLHLRV